MVDCDLTKNPEKGAATLSLEEKQKKEGKTEEKEKARCWQMS